MRAHNFADITGKRFHMLVPTRCVGHLGGKTRWECACDCGQTTVKAYQHLVLGLTKSCGCLRRKVAAESLRKTATVHGLSKHAWYSIWAGMMDRCYNANFHRYHRYGGRGITVCDRWHDPRAFHADMGDVPDGLSIERIDNDRGYSPDNCRWASCVEQNNNRASTRRIEFRGESLSGAQWARRLGIDKATMYWRLREWPIDRALTEPPDTRRQ